jgi:hypothetical protein
VAKDEDLPALVGRARLDLLLKPLDLLLVNVDL